MALSGAAAPHDVKAIEEAKRLYGEANTFYQAGKFDDAIARYNNLIKLNPQYPQARNARKAALVKALQQPSEAFFKLLLVQSNWEMFGDIADEKINKENLLTEIKKLPPVLKQNVLCQALIRETFLGRLFHQGGVFRAPGISHGILYDIAKLLEVEIAEAKNVVWLNEETIAALCRDERLITDLRKAFHPQLYGALYEVIKPAIIKKAAVLHGKGCDFLYARKPDDAIACYDSAIELNPNNALYYVDRSAAYIQKNGEPDQVIEDCSKAIKLDRDDVGGYVNRGLAYEMKGQFDLAIADFSNAIKLYPLFATAYYNRAGAYLLKGQFDLAIKDCNKAIELGYQGPRARNCRKEALVKALEQPSEAFFELLLLQSNWEMFGDIADEKINKESLLAKIKKLPAQLKSHVLCQALIPQTFLGKLFSSHQDEIKNILLQDEKLHVYGARYKVLRPVMMIKKAKGLFAKGNDFLDDGNFDDAIASYNSAIELNFSDAVLYNNRGYAYSAKNQFDLAMADYNEAISLDPRVARVYINRGGVHEKKGWPDLAIMDYHKAIELDPHFASAYNARGYIYYQRGQLDLALADFNKAIKLDPRFAIAYFNHGAVYEKKGQLDLALADYNKAIELDFHFACAYNDRGCIYYRKKQFDLAIKDFNKAIESGYQGLKARNNRKEALVAALQEPSEAFFELLLLQSNWKMFSAIANEKINKKNLLTKIKKLPAELKLHVLCQALIPQTFFGKLFSSHQNAIENILQQDEKLHGMLREGYPVVYEKLGIREVVVVHPATVAEGPVVAAFASSSAEICGVLNIVPSYPPPPYSANDLASAEAEIDKMQLVAPPVDEKSNDEVVVRAPRASHKSKRPQVMSARA